MKQVSELNNNKSIERKISNDSNTLSVDTSKVSNIVLRRLIDEVRYENHNNILAYDRAHNRHNRGR